jgi:ryanodine receptor 2
MCSVRFMLGGEHGKLKHGPPEGHSPVSESLMPKEKLKIEPCFYLGNIPKGLICGPAEVRDYSAFVPKPVDTSHVSIMLILFFILQAVTRNMHI